MITDIERLTIGLTIDTDRDGTPVLTVSLGYSSDYWERTLATDSIPIAKLYEALKHPAAIEALRKAEAQDQAGPR